MKTGVIACLVTFITGAVLMLLQMWFEMLGITLVRRESPQERSLRRSAAAATGARSGR